MSFDWVLINEEGAFIVAKTVNQVGTFTVEEVGAVGIHEALSWIKELGVSEVDVKMDSQLVLYVIKYGRFL